MLVDVSPSSVVRPAAISRKLRNIDSITIKHYTDVITADLTTLVVCNISSLEIAPFDYTYTTSCQFVILRYLVQFSSYMRRR